MCCLEEIDESISESPHDVAQSQRSEDSYSQSLATRGTMAKNDDQSRAMSSSVLHGPDSDPDSSDNEMDQDDSEMASAASLFGSVVRTVGPRPTETARRATRRRMPSPEGQRTPPRVNDGHASDASRDLLVDTSDDEEDEMQALDVSTRRNTYDDNDRGNTSSPELVYGRQH